MIEAECTRCHQTFVPEGSDPEDLIHGECGGIGVIQGQWVAPGTDPHRTLAVDLTPQERHGLEMPNCDSPNCPHHFPGLFAPCHPGR